MKRSNKKTVTAVVMASGLSRRMGVNKLLLPYDGAPLVARVIRTLLCCGSVTELLLVTGYPEVAAIGRELGVKVIDNPHGDRGISESIRLGARCAKGGHIMFVPADQPFLDAQTIETLLRGVLPGRIVQPVYNGNAGGPVVFPAELAEELAALQGDNGGREVLKNHPEMVLQVRVDNERAMLDIDTAKDYEALVAACKQR